MTHVALVEFHIRPDRLEQAREVVADLLQTSRAYPGCSRLDWLVDREDPTVWTLYEEWDSWEQEADYRAFRAGEGAVPALAEILADRPRLTRLDRFAQD